MLDDLVLPEKSHLTIDDTGIDSLTKCIDKEHFVNYPHTVTYQYNSRGFRDHEWPSDLSDAIWCLGDSFTVGIGSPREHTWPHLLEQALNQRCINVSLDGASNLWIKRQAIKILNEVKPKMMILHWSFFHRDEHPDAVKSDIARREFFGLRLLDTDAQIKNFLTCYDQVESLKGKTKIIHSLIPGACEVPLTGSAVLSDLWKSVAGKNWPDCPHNLNDLAVLPITVIQELKKFNVYDNLCKLLEHLELPEYHRLVTLLGGGNFIPEFKILDYARDGYHYDKITADRFVNEIIERMKTA